MRLDTLARNIATLKEILRGAGGTYSDLVKQLETAEIELNEVTMNLKNIEVKHETGEIPLETYRRQLSELGRRKEKAEASIDSLLLRLRGESQ
jgi:DNA repair ATPase RecN